VEFKKRKIEKYLNAFFRKEDLIFLTYVTPWVPKIFFKKISATLVQLIAQL